MHPPDGRRHAWLQLRVALDAARERLFELEAELRENLAELLGHLVVAYQNGAHDTGLDHPSLGQIPIAGEQNPAFSGRLANQLRVADPRVIRGIISQCAQPPSKASDVAIGQESRLHHCHLRIVPVATSEDLMTNLRKEAGGCYSWSNGPGDTYAPHSHSYEKVLYCIDGSITFVLEGTGRRLELTAGDRMVLPAGTVHAAEVGPRGCTCIEGQR